MSDLNFFTCFPICWPNKSNIYGLHLKRLHRLDIVCVDIEATIDHCGYGGNVAPEIGQEAPLFDEQSIVFDEDADSVMLLRGRVVMAHEVHSFVPEGDTVEYWIVDRSGALEREYDRVTGGQKNGSPAEAELKVRYKGPSDEGFAAEYEGVFEVVELVSIGKAEE